MGAAGFTLIETLLAVGLLIAGVCVILFGMHFATIHSEYLAQMQIARSAAQGLLERLSTMDFDTLETGAPQFNNARAGGQRCELADLDCDGDPDIDAAPFDRALTNGALIVQIKSNGNLLDLHVAACWQHRTRPIGEDLNCDGVVDLNEDANSNNWVDSPVMVSTRIGPP